MRIIGEVGKHPRTKVARRQGWAGDCILISLCYDDDCSQKKSGLHFLHVDYYMVIKIAALGCKSDSTRALVYDLHTGES
jgi:hypothetical protein